MMTFGTCTTTITTTTTIKFVVVFSLKKRRYFQCKGRKMLLLWSLLSSVSHFVFLRVFGAHLLIVFTLHFTLLTNGSEVWLAMLLDQLDNMSRDDPVRLTDGYNQPEVNFKWQWYRPGTLVASSFDSGPGVQVNRANSMAVSQSY